MPFVKRSPTGQGTTVKNTFNHLRYDWVMTYLGALGLIVVYKCRSI